ncbi:leucine--tRNA ligase [Candidatus Nomurabacteria bacterium]|nr:leucine--tRNA ligase [Candidatus Nomurabacteria bacterium]
MSDTYDHKEIEAKWRKKWQEDGIYKTEEDSSKPKYYCLDMFPYPSGDGLHVGHPKGYIATDIVSRYKKMNGFNILHPMGWDAFGLPAENYAIKNKIHPRIAVEQNIERFKKQLELLGFNYDWSREINTTDPSYYKWTQWAFIKMFEKGLAYESNEPINWCPSCKTGLANEDVEDGKCERCGTVVEKKPLRQWVLKIREYADRLLSDVEKLDWPESIKESQRNWIGKSEGAEVIFKIKDSDLEVPIYTTRIDTIYSGTFIILAPEHPLIDSLMDKIENSELVEQYRNDVSKIEDKDRTTLEKEKTGVELKGVIAINPATKEEVPVWIADFVLFQYGTGAVFADAHDQRDFDLAKKYNIPLKVSIVPNNEEREDVEKLNTCFEGEGILINSEEFDSLSSAEARPKIIEKLEKEGLAKKATNYKLRDWVFSRQRYWGEPIPIIHCQKCGPVAVPEADLPVKLPEVDSYEPTGTGESPLANISEWVNTKCPKCGGEGKRETNTMPQWAGSSWYYLRFEDNKNDSALVDKEKEKYWSSVDLYVGGAEHATRHLIYARFWHKFLFDIGAVNYDEPFTKLQHVGLINASDGRKMSKRWGNVINPDDIVETLGADTLRVYEMFMGPFDQGVSWSEDGVVGPRRFLEKVWKLKNKISEENNSDEIEKILHKTIKKVSEDISSMSFNTAISQMMILTNALEKEDFVNKENYKTLILLLAPFAPHITEEINIQMGNTEYLCNQKWPEYDLSKIEEKNLKIGVQINGKLRGVIEIEKGFNEDQVKKIVENTPEVVRWLEKKTISKFIYIPEKVISIVISE